MERADKDAVAISQDLKDNSNIWSVYPTMIEVVITKRNLQSKLSLTQTFIYPTQYLLDVLTKHKSNLFKPKLLALFPNISPLDVSSQWRIPPFTYMLKPEFLITLSLAPLRSPSTIHSVTILPVFTLIFAGIHLPLCHPGYYLNQSKLHLLSGQLCLPVGLPTSSPAIPPTHFLLCSQNIYFEHK